MVYAIVRPFVGLKIHITSEGHVHVTGAAGATCVGDDAKAVIFCKGNRVACLATIECPVVFVAYPNISLHPPPSPRAGALFFRTLGVLCYFSPLSG